MLVVYFSCVVSQTTLHLEKVNLGQLSKPPTLMKSMYGSQVCTYVSTYYMYVRDFLIM